MIFDFFIVGNGLAGSLIANELLKAGKKIRIFDNPLKQSSSSVAGGMFNPVTGKYLTKTWLDEQLFSVMFGFYKKIETDLNIKILFETGIFRPFSNLENKQHFKNQIEKNQLTNYIDILEESEDISSFINAPFGGLHTKLSGWVNVPILLEALQIKFQTLEILNHIDFDFKELSTKNDAIQYKNLEAKQIIFSEGFYAKDNPFFNWLPFNPVKGETILGEIENYNVKSIINQGKWLIPLSGNKIRLGATYSWHSLDFKSTESAKEQLLIGANKFLKKEIKIISQQAGVRPSTQDRRPFIGTHPKYKNIHIFNGLGTKGVSLAPYFVSQFIEMLLFQKDIHPETTIERYFSLYSYR